MSIISFKHIESDPEFKEVIVNYYLEGKKKQINISWEHLTSFVRNSKRKMAGYSDDMGIAELDVLIWSDTAIIETSKAFINDFEKVDLIMENRELREINARLHGAMIAAKTGMFLIDYLEKDAERVVYGADWVSAKLPKHNKCKGELEICKHAKSILREILNYGEGKK